MCYSLYGDVNMVKYEVVYIYTESIVETPKSVHLVEKIIYVTSI